jgi:arylsulfatase A-like enzyme
MKYLFPAMCTLILALTSCQQSAPQLPNVILMMADDLAIEDLSCYGSTRIETPHIDQLADEGLKLTGFYAGNPVCSPSRMALLSGSYPARLGWRWGVLGYGFAPGTGMSPEVVTIAEAFRENGYHTAMSGKWHLGEENMSPGAQGFDSSYYITMSNNQNRDMYRDGKLIRKAWDNRLLTETFAEEVIRVIREAADQPFFLYVPWSAPHFPVDPHPDWHGKSGESRSAKYTDVVEELDHRIGDILQVLEETGRADNTIVIFTSDNGRQPGQEDPDGRPRFSGRKWLALEGGTRVPFIIRYPGAIEAGGTRDQIVSAIDLYPTLAEACGIDIQLPPGAQQLDGVSVWNFLTSEAPSSPRRELLYWHGRGQATAIRVGDWKLFFNNGGEHDPEVDDGPLLFNLDRDPREKKNLAAEHLDQVEAMLARAQELLNDVYGNQVPIGILPGAEPPEPPLTADDVWGPWIR